MWYYIDDYARGVATADTPTGPFKIVHNCVPNLQLGSDFFFWTGTDGEVCVVVLIDSPFRGRTPYSDLIGGT